LLVATSCCLAACAAPLPAKVARKEVGQHVVVVVEEDDPTEDAGRGPPRITHAVADGPLGNASALETAFNASDPRYETRLSWRGDCFDVFVARHGLAPYPDFDAHGCVHPEAPATPVTSVVSSTGAVVTVLLWILDAPDKPMGAR
jgi:hypothetical protein